MKKILSLIIVVVMLGGTVVFAETPTLNIYDNSWVHGKIKVYPHGGTRDEPGRVMSGTTVRLAYDREGDPDTVQSVKIQYRFVKWDPKLNAGAGAWQDDAKIKFVDYSKEIALTAVGVVRLDIQAVETIAPTNILKATEPSTAPVYMVMPSTKHIAVGTVSKPIALNAGVNSLGGTNTVDVPIMIGNNPGLSSFSMRINYDKAWLKPVAITAGDALPSLFASGTINSDAISNILPEENTTTPAVIDQTLATITHTSITLDVPAGPDTYEYSMDNGLTWQDSNTFSELLPNTKYSFIQRIKADTVNNIDASVSSAAVVISTIKEPLTGTVVTGTEHSNTKPINEGDVLTATLTDSNANPLTEQFDYQWYSNDTSPKTAIPGATNETYRIDDTYPGPITVEIIAKSTSNFSGEVESAPVTVANNRFLGKAVTGAETIPAGTDLEVGDTLTAELIHTNVTPANITGYEWYEGGQTTPISNETAQTYTIGDGYGSPSDAENKSFFVEITMSDGTKFTSDLTPVVVADTVAGPETYTTINANSDPLPAPSLTSRTTASITVSPAAEIYSFFFGNWTAGSTPTTHTGLTPPGTPYELRQSGALDTSYSLYVHTQQTWGTTISGSVSMAKSLGSSEGITMQIGDSLEVSVVSPSHTCSDKIYDWMRSWSVGSVASKQIFLPSTPNSTYTLTEDDLGKFISVRVSCTCQKGYITGNYGNATNVVKKMAGPAAPTRPDAPPDALITHNSIELLYPSDGNEYEFMRTGTGGTVWQKDPLFTNLAPNTLYSFVQRIAETNDTLSSDQSEPRTLRTLPAQNNTFDGSAGIINTTRPTATDYRLGDVLAYDDVYGGTTTPGEIEYEWYRWEYDPSGPIRTLVGTTEAYTIVDDDIGNIIYLSVTSTYVPVESTLYDTTPGVIIDNLDYITAVWSNSVNFGTSGTLFNVRFEVLQDASGQCAEEIPIWISNLNATKIQSANIVEERLSVFGGGVYVIPFSYGVIDIDYDTEQRLTTQVSDLVELSRYFAEWQTTAMGNINDPSHKTSSDTNRNYWAADIEFDGVVNNKDIVRLAIYIKTGLWGSAKYPGRWTIDNVNDPTHSVQY